MPKNPLSQDEITQRHLAIARLSGKIHKLEISKEVASKYLPISCQELDSVLKLKQVEKNSVAEIGFWINLLDGVPPKEVFFEAGGEFRIFRGLKADQLKKLKSEPGNFWKVTDQGTLLIPNINAPFEENYLDQLAVVKLVVMDVPQTIKGIVCIFESERKAVRLTLEGSRLSRFEPTVVQIYRAKKDIEDLRKRFLK